MLRSNGKAGILRVWNANEMQRALIGTHNVGTGLRVAIASTSTFLDGGQCRIQLNVQGLSVLVFRQNPTAIIERADASQTLTEGRL